MNIDEYLDSVASTKTKKPKGSEQSQESQSHSQVHQEESAKERAHTLELSQSVKDLQKNWLTLVDAQITELDVVISTGNFSSALEHYTRLRTLWSDLTNMHSHLFTHLKSELISAKSKINDLYKRLEQDYIKHEHDILQLLSVLQDEIAQKNVETATKLYETVHKLFDEIPEEFSEKKSLLHSKIMYEHLQLQKIQIHHVHKTHNDFFSQYNMLLQKLATALKGQNVHVAKQTYVQCEELFKKFPQGYAHHKHQVYDYLVKARTKIVELERHGRVTVSTSQPTAAPHSQPAKASLSHKPVQQPHTTQPIKQSSPAKPASPLQKPVSQPSVAPPAKQPSSITPAPAKPASPLQKPVSQPSVAPPVKQPSSITPAPAKPASPLQKPVSQPSVAPPVKQSSSVTPPPSKPLSQPIKPVAPLTPQPSFKKPIKTRETQSDDGSSHKLHELIQTKAPANHISSTLSQSRSTNPNISLDSKQFEPIKQPSQPAVEQKPPAPSPQPAPPISQPKPAVEQKPPAPSPQPAPPISQPKPAVEQKPPASSSQSATPPSQPKPAVEQKPPAPSPQPVASISQPKPAVEQKPPAPSPQPAPPISQPKPAVEHKSDTAPALPSLEPSAPKPEPKADKPITPQKGNSQVSDVHNFLLKGHHEDTPKENRPIYSDHMHSHNQPFHEMPSHPDPYSQNHSDEIEQKANKIRAQLLAAKQDLQKNCI